MKVEPPETPYPRHWLYYLILKFAILVGGVVLALYLYGLIGTTQ